MKKNTILLPILAGILLVSACKKTEVPPIVIHGPGVQYVIPAGLTTFEDLLNHVRAHGCYCDSPYVDANYAPPVMDMVLDPVLSQVALGHSQDMDNNNYFGHNDQNGHNGGQRLTDAGYVWQAWAENIAFGYTDERAVFIAWLQSPTHCPSMMSENLHKYGLGRSNMYWTMMMATPF